MTVWIIIFLVIAGGLFVAKLAYVISAGLAIHVTRGALFVSTPRSMIKAIMDNVPMASSDLFVDLGCGDGRVLRAAKKAYDVKTLGFEVNPIAWVSAKVLNILSCRVVIKRENFWLHDFSGTSVVFCYLFPDIMERLAVKLKDELRPGAVVVSCNFPFPRWNVHKTLKPGAGYKGDPVYIYRIQDV